jgi:signal transduction histidine kinase
MSNNQNTKTTSIIGQIALRWQLKLLSLFFWLDVFLALLATAGWCLGAEISVLGNPYKGNGERYFSFDGAKEFGFKGFNFDNMYSSFHNSAYNFGGNSVSAGIFFEVFFKLFMVLLFMELLIWFFNIFSSFAGAKRILRPLNQLALSAGELSYGNFADLENAIDRMNPADLGEHLSTGNRELQGIEKAINSLIDRMRESYRQQSQFVSDASHELRTPIAVIKGYSEMLDRWGKEDEKVLNEGITAIKNESEHMNRLIEQLLFLARGENGKQPMSMTDFSLGEMLKEVYSESVLIDKNHEYHIEVAEDITVYGDISLLKQTARILADNAVKYTPAGQQIVFRVKKNSSGDPCFEIQDDGIGIAPEHLPHLFERFYRADPARSRETGGTGLGLSIAKWIVDKHNGYFEIVSYEGVGTRISVCLPVQNCRVINLSKSS